MCAVSQSLVSVDNCQKSSPPLLTISRLGLLLAAPLDLQKRSVHSKRNGGPAKERTNERIGQPVRAADQASAGRRSPVVMVACIVATISALSGRATPRATSPEIAAPTSASPNVAKRLHPLCSLMSVCHLLSSALGFDFSSPRRQSTFNDINYSSALTQSSRLSDSPRLSRSPASKSN